MSVPPSEHKVQVSYSTNHFLVGDQRHRRLYENLCIYLRLYIFKQQSMLSIKWHRESLWNCDNEGELGECELEFWTASDLSQIVRLPANEKSWVGVVEQYGGGRGVQKLCHMQRKGLMEMYSWLTTKKAEPQLLTFSQTSVIS